MWGEEGRWGGFNVFLKCLKLFSNVVVCINFYKFSFLTDYMVTAKYETSETTVRNLKMCFLVSSQRFSPSINFFVCLLNDELTHKKTIFKAEDLICPIERVREWENERGREWESETFVKYLLLPVSYRFSFSTNYSSKTISLGISVRREIK